MICNNCNEELYMSINVIMEIPSSMESLLSKKNIAKKEVKINGVSWDSAYYFCKNPNCSKYRKHNT